MNSRYLLPLLAVAFLVNFNSCDHTPAVAPNAEAAVLVAAQGKGKTPTTGIVGVQLVFGPDTRTTANNVVLGSSAVCPEGKVPITGGYQLGGTWGNGKEVQILENRPWIDPNDQVTGEVGWRVEAIEVTQTGSLTILKPWAVCVIGER